jgi:succinate-semialdehyde dehydrogenase/glutarate-semialdehyde dehydrogenase
LVNSGQSCVAAKRFIVVDSVVEEFERLLVEEMGRYRVGDPLGEMTDLGPLARLDLRDVLHDQVMRSVGSGARCLLGGEVPLGVGAFYPPTVLGGVRPGMAAFDEETFGPVAAVVPVSGEEEAILLANQSEFGLGAAVFSGDRARGERVALELEAGCCVVNGQVKSDPRQPFGGIKASGYGRELGLLGIREFMNAKTMVVG